MRKSEPDPEGFRAKEHDKHREGAVFYTEQDTNQLIDLLRSILTLDPDERPPFKAFINHLGFSEKVLGKIRWASTENNDHNGLIGR